MCLFIYLGNHYKNTISISLRILVLLPILLKKKKSLWLQYLITSFQQKGKKKSIPMASTSNNSSLLSDQDTNQFLV